MPSVQAEPYEFVFDPRTTALLVIDMQRDFVDPGGFDEALGNDVSLLRRAVPPTERVLGAARDAGLFVVHTREGQSSTASSRCPASRSSTSPARPRSTPPTATRSRRTAASSSSSSVG